MVFLVLLTNKMDETVKISYFAAASPLFLTFFTLIITSFGSRGKSAALICPALQSSVIIISLGGNQYWFGLRKPPCQFLFSVCPCLQLFGNVSYSLYTHNNNNRETNRMTDIDLSLDIFPSKTKLER